MRPTLQSDVEHSLHMPSEAELHITYDADRSPFRDGVLDVAAAAAQLLVASLALGVLAGGPVVAFRLVQRWLR